MNTRDFQWLSHSKSENEQTIRPNCLPQNNVNLPLASHLSCWFNLSLQFPLQIVLEITSSNVIIWNPEQLQSPSVRSKNNSGDTALCGHFWEVCGGILLHYRTVEDSYLGIVTRFGFEFAQIVLFDPGLFFSSVSKLSAISEINWRS